MSVRIAAVGWLFTALAWVAAALAAVMMVTTFVDVVMRYFFNRPILGAFEVTEIAMGLLVFFALPLVIHQRENIVVNIVYDLMPDTLRRVVTALSDLVCAVLCGFIAWRMWLFGARLLSNNEVTMELQVPRGGIAQTMAVLMAVATAAFVISAWQALRRGVPLSKGI